jgi:hypothetical protein
MPLSASHDVAQGADALGPAFDTASSDEQQDLLASGLGGGGQPVPEPGTLLLVGSGLVGVALANRIRRRRS